MQDHLSTDRRGWPWDAPARSAPPARSDGSPWPRISIVTPSYNQGMFLEETLRSVILQGYPALELLVYDGGSSDGSVAILQRYAEQLTHWESGPDRGQAHALNKGFARATGDIVAWLNSDDLYMPGALFAVGEALRPERGRSVVFGECQVIDEASRPQPAYARRRSPITQADWVPWWGDFPAMQPAIFMSRAALLAQRRDDGAVLDEALRYAFDYDLWLRLSEQHSFQPLPVLLAAFRRHGASKSLAENERFIPEMQALSRPHWGRPGSVAYRRTELSAHVHVHSIGRAYHAVEQAAADPWGALETLARAVAAFPVGPLLRPRPFLAAARQIARRLRGR